MGESLASERAFLEALLEKMPSAVAVMEGQELRFTLVNAAYQEMVGPGVPLLGRTIAEVFPEAAAAGDEGRLRRVLDTGEPWVMRAHYAPVPGKPDACWEGEAVRLPGGNGGRPAVLLLISDVTERERAQQQLRLANQTLKAVLDSITDGLLMVDRDWRFTFCNEQGARVLGRGPDELIGRVVWDAVPDTGSKLRDAFHRAVRSGEPVFFDEFFPEPANTWFECRCYPSPEGLSAYFQDITDRKNAEEALRESEDRFRTMADNISQLAWMADASGWLFWYNHRWYEYTGTVFEDMQGWGWSAVHHPAHLPRVVERFRRSLDSGEAWEDVFPLRGRDGEYRWFLSRALPIRDDSGRVVRWFGTNTDITEHLEAEERLRESERRYRGLFESMQEGFALAEIITDPDGNPIDWRFLDVNPRFEKMYGKTREEFVGKRYRELFPHRWSRELMESVGRVAMTGERTRIEREYDGNYYDSIVYSPTPGLFALISVDVTGRRQADEALRASEERYRTLFTSMSEGFAVGEPVFDADGSPIDVRFLEFNDAFERQSGLGREILGKPLREVLPQLEPEWIERYCEVALNGGAIRFEQYNADTARYYSVYCYSPAEGRFAILFRDVTEMKRAEEAIRESERNLRRLADSMPQLVWVADPNGRITFVNRQWDEHFGVTGAEALGDGWSRFLHPDDHDATVARYRQCIETGELYEIETRLRTGSGEYRWMLSRALPVRDDQGRITRWFGTCTDIEETKRAEEKLRETQKLESVGLLAGGIAHDFNNLLTGILGNASLVIDELSPEHASAMREVMRSAEKAAHLTRQLLAYSGKGQFVIREIDVAQAVNETADLVQFSIPKSVDLAVSAQRRLPPVLMDPGQLQQILMNLVINAGEAVGEGNPGRVSVSTSLREIAQPFRDALAQTVEPGRYICIEVTDTGAGMDAAQIARIFEPFYTTKFTGRGLGLAAVAGIVRSQRGAMLVESEPGRGSAFRVLLRVAEQTAERPSADIGSNAQTAVLVVDDEPSVRDFIRAVLRKNGYRVMTASDGKEALRVFERDPAAVHAVVLDVVMPAMGANELLPMLMKRRPQLKVLLTSGYSESEARRLCVEYPGSAFIQKPYTAQQIAAALKSLLD